MGGFAVGRATANQTLDAPAQFDAAPVPFWGSVQAGFEDARKTRNNRVRETALRDELWSRHRAAEKALGRKLTPSAFMINSLREARPDGGQPIDAGLDPRAADYAGLAPDISAYESTLEDLRAKNPQAFAAIPTLEAVTSALDRRLKDVRDRADAAGGPGGHWTGVMLGEIAGSLTDPPNLALNAIGGLGLARTFGMRIAQAGLSNAAVEAAQVPGRIKDAKIAGPAYTAREGAGDIAGAAIGGAALDVGAQGLEWVAKKSMHLLTDPAARGAVRAMEAADHAAAILGNQDGPTHEAGLDALIKTGPRPEVPPAEDLTSLFPETPLPPSSEPFTGPAQITGQTDYLGRRIYQGTFDPKEVGVDPARFQYKAEGDAEGVTARLKGIEAWDATASGKVIVWEQKDGKLIIADGHQRRGLAARLADKGWDPRLDGYLFREADGWTSRQVRTVAALKNIREGSGSILDAAKLFRDAPEAIKDRSLPVTGDFITQARALAQLSPDAFGAVVNKVIPERYAAEIGAMASSREDMHGALVKLLKDGEPASVDEARALISEGMLDDFIKSEGAQADLFGGVAPELTTIARAKIKNAILTGLRKDARLFGQLVKNADAIEAGGNVLLRDGNEAQAVINRTALEILSRLSLRSGEIGDAMAAAAAKVAEGARPADAARGLVTMIKRRIASGEKLEGVRIDVINPEAPSAAALDMAQVLDDPTGAAAQGLARTAPEDVAIEAPDADQMPGLFDDLGLSSGDERAHARLLPCAPGE